MTDQNPFHAPIASEGAQVPIEQHRAVQEVQAAMIIAKKFPRDQHAAYSRIMAACERSKLAEAASYDYPKGKTMVTGPTIRLAEVMAQNWGNLDFGIKELSQDGSGSEVQAYAWDMETNVRQSKTFIVPHKMKAHGSFKTLSDPRDIYEHVANMGARRLRACILGVIPGDIVDAAVIKCEETLTKGDGKPVEDRVRDMLARFKDLEISQELIEQRLQHKTTAIVRSQLVELGKIYNSIKDGMSKRSDWFDVPKSQQAETSDLTAEIQKKAAEQDAEVGGEKEKPTTLKLSTPCPYCSANIKTVIVQMLESGANTFVCPACKKEGKIEDGEPVVLPPVDAEEQEKGEQKTKPETWGDWRKEWINKKEAGFATYFHKNRAGFDVAPTKLKEEARVKWLKLYPETPWPLAPEVEDPTDALLEKLSLIGSDKVSAASAELGFDDVGRELDVFELKALLEKCKQLDELSPEGRDLNAVNKEINKYPMNRVDEAQKNLELPTNRVLDLDESNRLLEECGRLTKGG